MSDVRCEGRSQPKGLVGVEPEYSWCFYRPRGVTDVVSEVRKDPFFTVGGWGVRVPVEGWTEVVVPVSRRTVLLGYRVLGKVEPSG